MSAKKGIGKTPQMMAAKQRVRRPALVRYLYPSPHFPALLMMRTVILRMDGVIIDTEPLHKQVYHTLFAELGIPVSAAEYATFPGKSTRNICERLQGPIQPCGRRRNAAAAQARAVQRGL